MVIPYFQNKVDDPDLLFELPSSYSQYLPNDLQVRR